LERKGERERFILPKHACDIIGPFKKILKRKQRRKGRGAPNKKGKSMLLLKKYARGKREAVGNQGLGD